MNYYKVHITNKTFIEYSHPLSYCYYKRCLFTSKSESKLDIKSFTNAMILLKVNPRLECGVLRKLLLNIMPPGSYLNAAFLNNFKTRAALYHAKHSYDSEISENDAKTMLVHRRIDKN